MERIGIETTQNVLIQFELASLGDRVLAGLLDFLFMISYLVLVGVIIGITKLNSETLVFLLIIPLWFYSLVLEMIFQGQTLGKIIMKIKVIKTDGTQPGFINYVLRWLFRIIDIWLFYGAVAILSYVVGGKGQRVGDIAAGTTVVKTKIRSKIENSIHKELPSDYQLKYPDTAKLDEEDIRLIKKVLDVYFSNRSENSMNIIKEMVAAVEKKANLKAEHHPIKFLETILSDYNYLHRVETPPETNVPS